MLISPRLIGVHPETGERANWKPILDRRTHDALVRLHADPTHLRSRRGERYLLTGLLFCGVCASRLTARPSVQTRRYGCSDVSTRAHLSISADRLESYVVDQAAEHCPDFDEPQVIDPAGDEPLLALLDDVDARIAAWSREAATVGLRAADIRAGHEALAAECATLEDQLAAAERNTGPTVQHFAEHINIETRPWLDAVIERIEIAPATKFGRVFDQSRVEIVWR